MTADPLSWITRVHGHPAWLLVYAFVALPLLIGLIRGRALGTKIAFFPILALPVTGLAVLFVSGVGVLFLLRVTVSRSSAGEINQLETPLSRRSLAGATL